MAYKSMNWHWRRYRTSCLDIRQEAPTTLPQKWGANPRMERHRPPHWWDAIRTKRHFHGRAAPCQWLQVHLKAECGSLSKSAAGHE